MKRAEDPSLAADDAAIDDRERPLRLHALKHGDAFVVAYTCTVCCLTDGAPPAFIWL